MDQNSHFGGHTIILFGFDNDMEQFYVSDRDNSDHPIRTPAGQIQEDFHLVSYTDILKTSILNTCDKILNPPATLKGITGIKKFANQIRKWNTFDIEKMKRAGVTNHFQISSDGGTGGGIFRKMYGNFLIEASKILEENKVSEIGKDFISLSLQWDSLANDMWQLYETGNTKLLIVMSDNIMLLYDKEMDLLKRLQSITYTL